MRLSIVVPTYNEARNVEPLLRELHRALDGIDAEVLVVDDDSPDGTAEAARRADPEARVLVRTQEKGLATAVVHGIMHATGDFVAVMDADFQHPPEAIRRLLERAEATEADLVVGSRYTKGGSEAGFGALRRLVSRGAAVAAKAALPPVRRFGLTDPMSGLFLVRRDRIDAAALRPQGYKILLEILARADLGRVEEVGYAFEARREGASKLGGLVILQYLLHLSLLGIRHPDNHRILRFGVVGALGVAVNVGLLWLLHLRLGLTDLLAVPIAIEAAIIHNFLLNDRFTFHDRRRDGFLHRLGMYNIVSLLALIVNFTVYVILTRGFLVAPIPAQLGAILVAFAANYAGNLNWTYGGEDRFRLRDHVRQVAPWAPFWIVVLVAVGLYMAPLDAPQEMTFDEKHYVPAAYSFAHGTWMDACWAHVDSRPLNWEHPPLAKLIMAASVAWSGDAANHGFEGCRNPDDNPSFKAFYDRLQAGEANEVAWRAPGAALAVLAVIATGLAAANIFRSPLAAFLGSGFVLADTMVFAMGRLAMLDIYAAGFTALAVHQATRPTRGGILLTGLFLGLGFASKYSVLFAGVPVLALLLWTHRRAGLLSLRRAGGIATSLLLVPPAVWLASHALFLMAWMREGGPVFALSRLVGSTEEALRWSTTGGPSHTFASEPAAWLLQARPVWMALAHEAAPGQHGFLYAVGNPWLWWLAIVAAVAALAVAAVQLLVSRYTGRIHVPPDMQALAVTALLPVMTYLPFLSLQRLAFLYYMVLLSPMLALMLAGALATLWKQGGAVAQTAVVFLVLLVGAMFLHFLPVVSMEPITMERFKAILIDTVPTMDPCPNQGGVFAQVCPPEGPLRP